MVIKNKIVVITGYNFRPVIYTWQKPAKYVIHECVKT